MQYQISNIVNNFFSLKNGQINNKAYPDLITKEPILFKLNNTSTFYNLIINFNFGNATEQIKPNNLAGFTIKGFKQITIFQINAFNADIANELLQLLPQNFTLSNYSYTVGKSFISTNYQQVLGTWEATPEFNQSLRNSLSDILNKTIKKDEYFNEPIMLFDNNAFSISTITNALQAALSYNDAQYLPLSDDVNGEISGQGAQTNGIVIGINLSSISGAITVGVGSSSNYMNSSYNWIIYSSGYSGDLNSNPDDGTNGPTYTGNATLYTVDGFKKVTNEEINETLSKYASCGYINEENMWPSTIQLAAYNETIINSLNEAEKNLTNNSLINAIRNYFGQWLGISCVTGVSVPNANASSGYDTYVLFNYPLTFTNYINLGTLPEISDSMNNETQINLPLTISWDNAPPLPLYGQTNNGFTSNWTTNTYTIQGFQLGPTKSTKTTKNIALLDRIH